MKRLSLVIFASLALPALSEAGFRIQHYAPELRWMSLAEVKPEQIDAAIIAPRGLSCNLPSKEGYCTIPLMWLSNKEDPSSLWRSYAGSRLKVAQGFDGQVNATLRFGQVIQYDILSGTADGGKVLDSAQLTAVWDDSWATNPPEVDKSGELLIDDEGSCQIYTDQTYCSLKAQWTTTGVQKATLWQKTPTGLRVIYEGAKEDATQVGVYDQGTVYELREGTAADGELLSAGMTRGYRVETAGEISLPDGESCSISNPKGTCSLRVTWSSNDLSRLWMREQASSSISKEGQSLVKVSASGVIADLRAGGTATGKLLDRASLSAVLVDNSGTITPDGTGSCEIPYSGTQCEQTVSFKVEKDTGSLWNEQGALIKTGADGTANVAATEYGMAYHLRAGTDASNPILSTYIAKGIRQTYRGSIQPTSTDSCVFNYQGGYCDVSVTYEATDNASIWDMSGPTVVAGGKKQDVIDVRLNDLTGNPTSTYNYDLKIHGGYSPRLSDPVLGSLVLNASQPTHSGSLAAPSGLSCSLLYGRNECVVTVSATTTATRASIWDQTTGALVNYVSLGTGNYTINVSEGTRSYVLREGTKATNKTLSTITLQAVRPSYTAQLTFPSGNNCAIAVSNGACTLSIKLNSNTVTRLRYRDITHNPNSSWAVATGSIAANATTSYTVSNVTSSKTYEFSVEQNVAPYTQLDVATATYTLVEPHTFSLTSVLPQPNSGIQCRAEWTNYYNSMCFNSTPITWTTTAPGVTTCRYADETGVYDYCLYSTTKTTNFGSYWSIPDRNYRLDFYEGGISVANPGQAQTNGYRLMHSARYVPARKLDYTEEAVSFAATQISCELVDVDDTECSFTYSINNTTPYDAVHQRNTGSAFIKGHYLARNGVRLTTPVNNYGSPGITSTYTYSKSIGEENIIELKLVGGSSHNVATDPTVSTLKVSSTYRNVQGNVQARRTNGGGVTYASGYYTDGSIYPYFFARQIISAGVYQNTSEPCLIQHHDSICRVYISGDVNNGSAASVFVDGVYLTSFSSQAAASGDSKLIKDLTIGDHTISIHEGAGSKAISAKKIDEFTISVRRPSYTGYLTPVNTTSSVNFPTDTVAIKINYSTNTRAYLYNTTSNTLLVSPNPGLGADEKFKITSSVTPALGEGTHAFELRTHADASDPNNIVLGSATVEVSLLPQTMAIKPRSGYTQWFNECTLSYTSNVCTIDYSYINTREETSSSSMSACNVLSNGSVVRRNGVGAYDVYRDAAVSILPDSVSVDFYYGPACPATTANTEGLTLLYSHPVVAKPAVVGVDIAVTKGSGTKDIQPSQVEPMTWVCTQSYQGDSCSHVVKVTSNPRYVAGQPINAFYGLFNGASYPANNFTPLGASEYEQYSQSSNIGGGVRHYRVQPCKTNNTSLANCPYESGKQVSEFKVVTYLPEYTAAITTPNGPNCMANYGASSCILSINVQSSSSYVTLYVDGVAKQSFNVGAGSTVNSTQNYTLTAKAKGVATLLEVRDGGAAGNRVLASANVYPEVTDTSIFKFTGNKGSGDYLADFCIISLMIPDENSGRCDYTLEYTSDATDKFIKTTGGSLSSNIVSGDGNITTGFSYNIASLPIPVFNHIGNQSYFSNINAYSDQAYTKMLDNINVGYRWMKYSDNVFSTPSDATNVQRQDPSRSYRTGSGYYLSNISNSVIFSGTTAVDDINLTRNSRCDTSTGYYYAYAPSYCSTIDYMMAYKSIAVGSQGSFALTADSGHKVKRIFYRKASGYASMSQLSDPVISVNGVARPLNLDGNWHYVDAGSQSGITATFSAINSHTSSVAFGLDIFAEHYDED